MAGSGLEDTFAFYLRACGVDPGVREYSFAAHLGRRFRFDFAWPEEKVYVEIEGGTWVQGRHNRGKGFTGDAEKYNLATLLGWRGLRFTTDMLVEDPVSCIQAVGELLEAVRAENETRSNQTMAGGGT